MIFTISGALSGLAGLLYASRFGYINPRDTGNGFELVVISAAIIGGVSVLGGSGSVAGVVLGCLVLGVVNTALPMLNVSAFWQTAVYGIAIVVAASIDTLLRRRREPS
jgi:rhamnose transport system permease protein